MQFWQTEGLFREGHRDAVIPKQGDGQGISDTGTRTNRDMSLGKGTVHLVEPFSTQSGKSIFFKTL